MAFNYIRMYLKNLSLINFKNYAQAELQFTPKINCFTGDNGSGKTNLLDALYYMAFTKSYFNPVDSQNIKTGEQFFVIEAVFVRKEQEEHIYCGVKKGHKKTFKRNKKEYQKLAEHIGLFPMVIISPYDIKLILEGSEERRRFMDSVISQYDKTYLDNLLKYNRALQHRNKLLKQFASRNEFSPQLLEALDDQMAGWADYIHEKRREFVDPLIPIFQEYYNFIAEAQETVYLDYQSALHEKDLKTLFTENQQKDLQLQYTSRGIHRDDLVFKIMDLPLKKAGSQGQQKTFLIALKLAQLDFMKQAHNMHTILLLDDIFDKLDARRTAKIISLVADTRFGQIFITDTNKERVEANLQSVQADYRLFEIQNGTVMKPM